MRVLTSALTHGITEGQILSALEVPMRYVPQGDRLLLVIGSADSAGTLIGIVIADPDTEDERVIHAMILRPKFYQYLR